MDIEKLKHIFLKKDINHGLQIEAKDNIKEAVVYCIVNNIPTQKYGILLENYIIGKFNYTRKKASECCGDCSKDAKTYEIKISNGGSSFDRYNYVQIRLNHDIHYYILTAYNLNNENLEKGGELFIFKVSNEEMKLLLASYGHYAHGTISKNGPITLLSLYEKENKYEYALRCKYGDDCWKDLQEFRIKEEEL